MQRRTEDAERCDNTVCTYRVRDRLPSLPASPFDFAQGRRGGYSGYCEPLHAKSFRSMRVQQLRATNISFTHNAADPRQGEFKFLRLRRRWHKQSRLCGTRSHGFGSKTNFYDRRARRMRLQIKLQQLEENSGVEQRHRQAQRAPENARM